MQCEVLSYHLSIATCIWTLLDEFRGTYVAVSPSRTVDLIHGSVNCHNHNNYCSGSVNLIQLRLEMAFNYICVHSYPIWCKELFLQIIVASTCNIYWLDLMLVVVTFEFFLLLASPIRVELLLHYLVPLRYTANITEVLRLTIMYLPMCYYSKNGCLWCTLKHVCESFVC